MLVDSGTLRDLDVLVAAEGGTPLVALLDHALTAGGHDGLRAKLRRPPSDFRELLGRQDAVRHLLGRIEPIRSALDGLRADDLEAYLGLRWEPARGRSLMGRAVERLVLRTRYAAALRDIERGAPRAWSFLDALPRLLNAMGEAPGALREPLAAIGSALDEDPLPEIRRVANPGSRDGSLRVDRLARGPGRDVLRRILAQLAEVDALQSLAFATSQNRWVLPEIVDDDRPCFDLLGLRHPHLPDGVPNDITWRADARVAAVTGPNMAGKTTLLRSAALAVYLAQCGAGVPARHARLSHADALFATLNTRDNLARGESFYLSEVRRIRQLAELLTAHRRVFAVIDEPFKGTNIGDASDASDLLFAALGDHPGCRVIVATHLAEVVRQRAGMPGLMTWYLDGAVRDGEARFDYALREGVSTQRLGMELLRREGVAELLERRFRPAAPSAPSS